MISVVDKVSRARYLMGCIIKIDAVGEKSEVAVEAAFSEMKRIEKLLSRFDEGSMVSEINRNAGRKKNNLSPEVLMLLQKSIHYSEETEGAFDITVKPLMDLWKSCEERGSLPTKNQIDIVLEKVGYEKIDLDYSNFSIRLKKGMEIDFGGIGKGYAVDRAVNVLKNWGIEIGMVSTGSNIYAFGDEVFIGIEDPVNEKRIVDAVCLKNQAISTSSQNQRFFEIRGKKYGHILDLKTGFPVQSKFESVSVITDQAMEGDVFSTALFSPSLSIKNFNIVKRKILLKKVPFLNKCILK